MAFTNKTVTNILVQIFLWTQALSSLGYVLKSKTSRLYGKRRCHFTRNRGTVIQSGDNLPHCHCRRMSVSHFTSLPAHGFQFFYILIFLSVCVYSFN